MHIWSRVAITVMGVSLFIWAFQTSASPCAGQQNTGTCSNWPPGTAPPWLQNSSGVDLGAVNVTYNATVNDWQVQASNNFLIELGILIGLSTGVGAAFVGLGGALAVVSGSIAGTVIIFNKIFFMPVSLLQQGGAPFPIVAVVGVVMCIVYLMGLVMLMWRQP